MRDATNFLPMIEYCIAFEHRSSKFEFIFLRSTLTIRAGARQQLRRERFALRGQ
jgi:hypothetical protein